MPSASPRTTKKTDDLQAKLAALGLRRIADECDDFIARATRNRHSPTQVLEEIARLEADERARRSVERRLSRARCMSSERMGHFRLDVNGQFPDLCGSDQLLLSVRKPTVVASSSA